MNLQAAVVAMSATIQNLDELARFLNADVFTAQFRPVSVLLLK